MIIRPIQILRIVLYYLIFGFSWIIMSDLILESMELGVAMSNFIQSVKGITFVLVSGLVISLLLWREGREKDVLLSEIHHRVKNNLAIISAFLELQADAMDKNPNPTQLDTKSCLFNSVQRIKTMAISHEILYNQSNLSVIPINSLIQNIWENCLSNCIQANPNPLLPKILFKKSVLCQSVDTKIGIPLAMILNELFVNSMTHAFPPNSQIHNPTVEVEIGAKEKSLYMIYRDNGIGLSDKKIFSKKEESGLGTFIIKTLTKQVHGEIVVDRERKMELVFYIPLKNQ